MPKKKPATFGQLKKKVSSLPDVRSEMRSNLIKKLEKNEKLFPQLIGYDETVIPDLVNAILCGHNVIILGKEVREKAD